MRIEQVELKIVRLPLVRPFQTSSSRKDHLDHILVRVVAGGVTGWGECASPSDPYYCPETTETCWHILRDFLAPLVLGREWSTIDELVGLLCSGQGKPLRPRRAGDGMLGPPGTRLVASRCIRCWEAPRRDPLGSQPGNREPGRRPARPDRPLPRRRLPPHQAQDRAGLGCRGRPPGPRPLSRDRASGRRQLGLHARRPAHAQGARRLRPALDRAAARPTTTSSTTPGSRSPSRPRSASTRASTRRPTPARPSTWAPAASSISRSAAWAACSKPSGSTTFAMREECRSGAAECTSSASAGRPTSRSPRCPASRFPAMSPAPTSTTPKTSSSRRSWPIRARSRSPTTAGLGVEPIEERIRAADASRSSRSQL